ncbi:hypothetical protein NQ318_005205, partial [Aromia moschata]
YNGEYFQQHEGTAMGNSLSPFIANLFMSKFETEVKDKFEYFPRVWFRYVDDIFAVFDTKAISLDNFVAKSNNRFPTIKFTYEVEHNEQLPFLDVLVIRNSENNNRLNFKFLVKLGKTFTETYAMLKEVYGNECLSLTQVFEWFKWLKEGCETTEDDSRRGWPLTSKVDENIEKI